MVPLVFSSGLGWVDRAEGFLDPPPEAVDDLRDTLGEEDFLRHGAVRLDKRWFTLSGNSTGSKTMSATLGDSVSLKAKSSVSVCFEALMISTHFSVHTPTVLYLEGSLGSSIIKQSPTPIVRKSFILSTSDNPQATS